MLLLSSTSKTWLNTIIKSFKRRELGANSTENLTEFIFLKDKKSTCYTVHLNMCTDVRFTLRHFELIDLSI